MNAALTQAFRSDADIRLIRALALFDNFMYTPQAFVVTLAWKLRPIRAPPIMFGLTLRFCGTVATVPPIGRPRSFKMYTPAPLSSFEPSMEVAKWETTDWLVRDDPSGCPLRMWVKSVLPEPYGVPEKIAWTPVFVITEYENKREAAVEAMTSMVSPACSTNRAGIGHG